MKTIQWLTALSLTATTLGANAQVYSGSTFNEVLSIMSDQGLIPLDQESIVKSELNIYKNNQLPKFTIKRPSFLLDPLGLFTPTSAALVQAAKRTTSERFDYYPRIEKLVHSNGICLGGTWKMDVDPNNKYTGSFKSGAKALFIGRISTALGGTETDSSRSFGIAGKIFDTLNPDQKIETKNFFTLDVALGTKSMVLDTRLTNQPAILDGGSNLTLGALGKWIDRALEKADQPTNFRPITHIAKEEAVVTKSPKWMRLQLASGQQKAFDADFRNEVAKSMQLNGGKLRFSIEVSETTSDRNASSGWTKIGEVEFVNSKVSYGCDRRLHFAHPKVGAN